MKTEIDNVEILSLEIELYGEADNTTEIDLGSLTLECDGRGYTLGVVQSYRTIEGGFTRIRCELERDDDTFPSDEHKYDLTATDLFGNPEATFYIVSDLPIEYITLFVRNNGCTRAIGVCEE